MGNAKLTPRNILVSLALKYKGEWDKIFDAIKAKETPDEELVEEASQTKAITLLDPEYPNELKQCYKPPLVLFYKGDISLLQHKGGSVAYVGSRDATPYGTNTAREICSGLVKKGYAIVSGLARGIDSKALAFALEGEGKAIAVLGSGIDNCYPKDCRPLYDALAEKGLIISEYPKDTPPTAEAFPFRNRIVAGLPKAVIVGEASRHSGTMVTVSYALSYNKDVGAVPFRAGEDSECNLLIKDGAFMIENADDALLMLGDTRRA